MSTIIKTFNRANLLAYWKFNEGIGNIIHDLSGNQKHGNISGNVNWITGRTGRALNFDGSTTQITLSPLTLSSTHTISIWFYPITGIGTTGYQTIITQDDVIGIYYLSTTKKIDFFYSGNDHQSTTAIIENMWNHFCIVCNAGAVSYYLNGSPDGVSSSGLGYNPNIMGIDPSSDTFGGNIDEIIVWGRALSASEVLSIYNIGATNIK